MKRRFPYLVHMRNKLDNAVKIVMCCVVLHNITISWRDELLDEEDPGDHLPPRDHIDEHNDLHFDDLDQIQRRVRGWWTFFLDWMPQYTRSHCFILNFLIYKTIIMAIEKVGQILVHENIFFL